MAFTQTQLDALESAIADGALTVKYSDKQVTYRSLDEMLRIRDIMRQSLYTGTSSAASPFVLATHDKGL